MDFFKFLAILGALAWLSPWIVPWVIKFFTKPEVQIYSHKRLEIGFTTFGPIFNVNFAFLAKKKDALIEKVELHLQHEKKELNYFVWEWFEEQILQMDTPGNGTMPLKKYQNAIAINLLQSFLTEKKIGFNNQEFRSKYDELFEKVLSDYNNKTKAGLDVKAISGEKSYNELVDLFQNSFFWKTGKYNVKINVYVENCKNPFVNEFNFTLTALDIERLKKNIETCKQTLKNNFVDFDSDFKEIWNWANPIKIIS